VAGQEVTLVAASEDQPVNRMKQRTAFPPNYVHSLDSTHLMMTATTFAATGATFAGVSTPLPARTHRGRHYRHRAGLRGRHRAGLRGRIPPRRLKQSRPPACRLTGRAGHQRAACRTTGRASHQLRPGIC
jgi:hypothetical protein